MDVRLLIVQGNPQGKELRFPPGEFVFGTGPECAVRPNSAWVSRQHCLLRVSREAVSIRDLASSTGTLVNGRRVVGEHPLNEGDRVQLGPLVLEVHGEPAA